MYSKRVTSTLFEEVCGAPKKKALEEAAHVNHPRLVTAAKK